MTLREFHESERDRWDDFIASRSHADIMQLWGWGNVKAGFSVWSVKRLGWESNGRLVAAAQVLRRRLPFSFSLLYVPRGPVLDWEDVELAREVLVTLAAWIRRDPWRRGALFLRIEPPAERSSDLQGLFLSSGFGPYFKTVQPPRTLFLDLTRTHEALLLSFRRTARNLIYRCEKESIRTEVVNGEGILSQLEEFYRLYRETASRFSFPARPLQQFTVLTNEFAPRGMLRLYRTLAPDGVLLAAGLVPILGSTAFYIWGGSERNHALSKFASYGFIWGMLRDLKELGIKTFDFWGIAPEEAASSRHHPWAGFTTFKTAFDGTPFDYAPAFDLPLSPLYSAFKLIDRIATPRYRATSA